MCLTYSSVVISMYPPLSLSCFVLPWLFFSLRPFALTCLVSPSILLLLFSPSQLPLCILLSPLILSLCLSVKPHSLSHFPLSQVRRIMVVSLRLVALTSARAQTAWCDAATEDCALCPRAFPRTLQSCEDTRHTQTHSEGCLLIFKYAYTQSQQMYKETFICTQIEMGICVKAYSPITYRDSTKHSHTLLQCNIEVAFALCCPEN